MCETPKGVVATAARVVVPVVPNTQPNNNTGSGRKRHASAVRACEDSSGDDSRPRLKCCDDGIITVSRAFWNDMSCLRDFCEGYSSIDDEDCCSGGVMSKWQDGIEFPISVDTYAVLFFQYVFDETPDDTKRRIWNLEGSACKKARVMYDQIAIYNSDVNKILMGMSFTQKLYLMAQADYLGCRVVSAVIQSHILYYDVDGMSAEEKQAHFISDEYIDDAAMSVAVIEMLRTRYCGSIVKEPLSISNIAST